MLHFHPAHRTGRACFRHPALGEDSRNSRSHCMRRCLQLLKTNRELLGLSPFSLSIVASCVRLQVRPLSSTGVTRLRRYYESLRHPSQPGLSLASRQLIHTAITAGTSRVTSGPLLPACRRHYPCRSDGNLFARTFPSASAFPVRQVGRLLHQPFRGLLSVHSCYGPHARRVAYATFYTQGFRSLVASGAAPIATWWSEQLPSKTFTRCGPTSFHGALNDPV